MSEPVGLPSRPQQPEGGFNMSTVTLSAEGLVSLDRAAAEAMVERHGDNPASADLPIEVEYATLHALIWAARQHMERTED